MHAVLVKTCEFNEEKKKKKELSQQPRAFKAAYAKDIDFFVTWMEGCLLQ